MKPKIGGVYRHFKGNEYEVKAIATHSETGEKMVVYQALYGDNDMYVRTYDSFVSKVDKVKYPEVNQEYRFELEQADESHALDPMVLQFLDTSNFEEKFTILTGLHHRITNDMIAIMAASMDVIIEEGELEDMYRQLKNCVDTRRRFESLRLR